MIDPNHAYTLHKTYTGQACAVCGKFYDYHPTDYWLVEGEKVPCETADADSVRD